MLTKQQVKDLQWLLSGHSRYHKKWYKDKVDGIYGQNTLEAVHDAKYDIGYSLSSVSDRINNKKEFRQFRSYMVKKGAEGYKRRTAAMIARDRKRKVKPSVTGLQIVRKALEYVGTAESPDGSNSGRTVRFFQSFTWLGGSYWPWCAAFVVAMWTIAMKNCPNKTAGAWDFINRAIAGGYAKPISQAQPGDAIAYPDGSGHINIFRRWLGDGWYETIGGNESNGVRIGRRHASTAYRGVCARHPKLLKRGSIRGLMDTLGVGEESVTPEALIATSEDGETYDGNTETKHLEGVTNE